MERGYRSGEWEARIGGTLYLAQSTCLSQGSTAYITYLAFKQQVESLAQPYISRPWEACTATIFNSGHAV